MGTGEFNAGDNPHGGRGRNTPREKLRSGKPQLVGVQTLPLSNTETRIDTMALSRVLLASLREFVNVASV